MKIPEKIRQYFFPPAGPLPGNYDYRSPAGAAKPYRMHLRLEKNGGGVLVLNASTVLHLNQTAAEYAYHLVKATPEDEMVKLMTKRYRASAEEIHKDFHDLTGRIQTLVEMNDLDPETFLDVERKDPYEETLSAPLRLDCALTYKTLGDSTSDSPLQRARRELTSEEWKTILDKAWAFGIPHVIFTGGEPTLRPDLVELVQHAQELGQVTGLLTGGERLCEKEYLHKLLNAGLDHIMLTLDPRSKESWEALRDALVEDIFVGVHITIHRENMQDIQKIVRELAELKIPAISLSTGDQFLRQDVLAARELAASLGLRLVWDLPVPYSQTNPVSIEISANEPPPQGAGKAWLYVEPDGDVLPGQGILRVLGNLTEDSWDKIWPVKS